MSLEIEQGHKGPGQAQLLLFPQWRWIRTSGFKEDLTVSLTHSASLKIFFFNLRISSLGVFSLCACLGMLGAHRDQKRL